MLPSISALKPAVEWVSPPFPTPFPSPFAAGVAAAGTAVSLVMGLKASKNASLHNAKRRAYSPALSAWHIQISGLRNANYA
jgi:hypothetical protein